MINLNYRCVGKFGLFFNTKGCGESFSQDFDKCPICRVGYLIPESMVTEEHRKNIYKIDRVEEEDVNIKKSETVERVLPEITPNQREQDLEMLCHWASQLVGNKGAFDNACEKWQESYERMMTK